MTNKNKEILKIVEDCLNRKSGSTKVVIEVSPEGKTTVEAISNLSLTFEPDSECMEQGQEEASDKENLPEVDYEPVDYVNKDDTDAAANTDPEKEVVAEVQAENEPIPDFETTASDLSVHAETEKGGVVPSLKELVDKF